MKEHVLVVEDDAVMRRVLLVTLRGHGYDASAAANAREALQHVEKRAPDAMILDLGLPDMDGVEVATAVRRRHELPIIVLSARGDEQQQIQALDAGANDYVTKPFREGELMARVRAALRRPVPLPERKVLEVGLIRIDALQRKAYRQNAEILLTPIEFKLLYLLARESPSIVTHQQLLSEAWGSARGEDVQSLRVYVKQLRRKLEADPARPQCLITALGVGYRLLPPDASFY
ncbi:MAG TPA: response regulator transcription factor [Polyangiaceae bacterium]|nr:response regulator transcription factor [Polyangiaceae bacterium]